MRRLPPANTLAFIVAAGLTGTLHARVGQVSNLSVILSEKLQLVVQVGYLSRDDADALSVATAQVEQLARDGDESAILVGVATPGQRAAAARVCREALSNLQQVEMDLASRIARLQDSDPEKAREIRATDLNLRLPLLRARASVLLGVAQRDVARLTGAIEQLEQIDPLAVAPASLRRHLLALALYHRAAVNGARAGAPDGDIARAIDLLRSMNDWPIGQDANTMRPPALAAETWFAQVRVATFASGSPVIAARAGEMEDRPPFVSDDDRKLADPGLFVRHAEVRAASLASLRADAPGKVPFDMVLAPITDGVRPERMPARGGGGKGDSAARRVAEAERTRTWLTGRVAAWLLEQGGDSQLEMPPNAVVAAGAELARDPSSRNLARTVLDGLLKRPDLGAALPEALFHSVIAMGDSTRARDRVEIVKRACRAIESGLPEPRRSALLAHLPGESARAVQACEDAKEKKLLAEAKDLRVKALNLSRGSSAALAGGGGATGKELAKAILASAGKDEQGRISVDAGMLTSVLDALNGQSDKESMQLAAGAVDACVTRARSLMIGAADTSIASGELIRAGESGARFFQSRDARTAARCRVALAEGYAASGDKRAVELYRELLSVEPPPESPAMLTLGLSRAQRAAGDHVAAFATLRAAVEVMEATPGGIGSEFFESWADMLEILAANNPTGSRNAQIRQRVAHLRSLDTRLGGPESKERIDLIESALKR